MPVTVRPARLEDLPALGSLLAGYAAAAGHGYDEAHVLPAAQALIEQPAYGHLLVLDDSGTLLGYAVLTWGFGLESGGVEALVDEIYVRPQGQGLGSVLMAAVLDAARAHGARTVFLETEAGNQAARRFHARHGFAVEDSVWMAQRLS